MRRSLIGVLATAAAALAFTVSASAAVPPGPGGNPFVNPGFETGCISLPAPIAIFPIPGWNVNTAGGSWLEVPSNLPGVPHAAQSGFCYALGSGGDANVFQTLQQTVNLGFGNQIRGWVRFTNNDTAPFCDEGRVRIYRVGPISATFTLFTAGTCTTGSTPWTLWTFNAPSAGAYTVSYEVRNGVDNILSSQLAADSHGLGSVSISPTP